MNCQRSRSLIALPDDAYRTLPFWRRWRVEAHLRRCPACRVEREALQQTDRLLRGIALPSAPDGLWEGVERRLPAVLKQEEPAWRADRRFPRSVWALATAVAVFLLLWFGWPHEVAGPQAEEGETFYYHQWLARAHPLNDNPLWDLMAPPGME